MQRDLKVIRELIRHGLTYDNLDSETMNVLDCDRPGPGGCTEEANADWETAWPVAGEVIRAIGWIVAVFISLRWMTA